VKIDVSSIVVDHIRTLHVADSKRVSFSDLLLFYATPFAAALGSDRLDLEARADAYNASITFFGIFIALLLNIQVAMFAIFQRKWDVSTDPRLQKIQSETLANRRALLTELNANISYLVLVCCAALLSSLAFYVQKSEHGVAPAIMVFLYIHFMLTLIMIIKRAHALFHKEYRDTNF
jgi:uncharacterized MAPEG superfamily protein